MEYSHANVGQTSLDEHVGVVAKIYNQHDEHRSVWELLQTDSSEFKALALTCSGRSIRSAVHFASRVELSTTGRVTKDGHL